MDIVQGNIGVWKNDDSDLEKEYSNGQYKTVLIDDLFEKRAGRTYVWGKMYKTDIVKRYRFPEERYYEDLRFNALYLTDTDVQKAGIIDTDTYPRYNNLKSALHLWMADDYLDIIKAIDEIYEIVKARPCSDSLKDRFVRQFFYSFLY